MPTQFSCNWGKGLLLCVFFFLFCFDRTRFCCYSLCFLCQKKKAEKDSGSITLCHWWNSKIMLQVNSGHLMDCVFTVRGLEGGSLQISSEFIRNDVQKHQLAIGELKMSRCRWCWLLFSRLWSGQRPGICGFISFTRWLFETKPCEELFYLGLHWNAFEVDITLQDWAVNPATLTTSISFITLILFHSLFLR